MGVCDGDCVSEAVTLAVSEGDCVRDGDLVTVGVCVRVRDPVTVTAWLLDTVTDGVPVGVVACVRLGLCVWVGVGEHTVLSPVSSAPRYVEEGNQLVPVLALAQPA